MVNKQKANNNHMKWWKIGLCALGILMIAGAIIYSLMIRNGASSGVSANAAATPAAAANNAQTSTGIGELNWVKDISQKFINSDFIFVILPGSADNLFRLRLDAPGNCCSTGNYYSPGQQVYTQIQLR